MFLDQSFPSLAADFLAGVIFISIGIAAVQNLWTLVGAWTPPVSVEDTMGCPIEDGILDTLPCFPGHYLHLGYSDDKTPEGGIMPHMHLDNSAWEGQ